jgi:CRP/FNR family transcriptional regulator
LLNYLSAGNGNRDAARFSAPVECSSCRARQLCLPAGATDHRSVDKLVGRRIKVARDSNLYKAGDLVGNRFYAIRYGSFKNYRADAAGQPRITGFQMSAEFLALDAIGLQQHNCTAVALEDSEVCEISCGSMKPLLPFFHSILSKEITDEQNVALLLRNTRAEQRLAAFLLNLSWRYGVRGFSPARFRLAMSRRDIADFLGLTPESVSRLMFQFKDQNLINVTGRDVTLVDAIGLKQLAANAGGSPGAALDATPQTLPLPRGEL